jgi:protein TonB
MICFYISAYAEDTHNQSQVQQQRELGISEELDRLEAQISKQQDEYRKSPRRKFIGSRTKEKRYATYVDEWWRKVQDVGSLNYPQAAKNLGLSGTLQLTVSILPDGAIERIEINRSSGHKILDDAAVDITKLASPFAPFSDEMKKDIDLLSITRTWTFTH